MIIFDKKIKNILISLVIFFSIVASNIFLRKINFNFNKSYAKSREIRDYNEKTDRDFILKIFKEDWYWLVSEDSIDFSPEYMLDNKASSRAQNCKNNLTIKLYYQQNYPAGFICYFMKSKYEGYILILAIDKAYRNKGYARALINYAINDLKKRGAIFIKIVTRTNNKAARLLYESVGFVQTSILDGFVYYRKLL